MLNRRGLIGASLAGSAMLGAAEARGAEGALRLVGPGVISTWDFGEIQEDWLQSWDDIEELDLQGKGVALFGLGDQAGYGEWFLDAMGLLHDKLIAKGCQVVGYWPNEGYEFETSKALVDEGRYFVGLALDETNQYEQTDERLALWLPQVLEEMAML